MQDQEDKSPLLAIAEEENPSTEILEYLIQQGATVNAKDDNGRIILYSVCKNENANVEVINIIIDASDNLTGIHINIFSIFKYFFFLNRWFERCLWKW